jgi:homoserine dehydrogenase
MIKVGLAGYGNLGKLIYDLLISDKNIQVKSVVTKTNKEKELIFSTDIKNIINDTDIDLVIEAISDTNVAKELVFSSIKNKKNVITANRELIHLHGKEICKLAKQNNVIVYFNSIIVPDEESKRLDVDSLTSENLHNYANYEIFLFRGGAGKIAAEEVYKDVYRHIAANSI